MNVTVDTQATNFHVQIYALWKKSLIISPNTPEVAQLWIEIRRFFSHRLSKRALKRLSTVWHSLVIPVWKEFGCTHTGGCSTSGTNHSLVKHYIPLIRDEQSPKTCDYSLIERFVFSSCDTSDSFIKWPVNSCAVCTFAVKNALARVFSPLSALIA